MARRRETGKQARLRVEKHARELGFRDYAEQTQWRRVAREQGTPLKPNTTREAAARIHKIAAAVLGQQHEKRTKLDVRSLPASSDFKQLLRDSIGRRYGIDYELHGYMRSAHHVFTFDSSPGNWNEDTWNRIRDGLMYRWNNRPRGVTGWIQGGYTGYFWEYGTHDRKPDLETRSLEGIPTFRFYERFRTPSDLAIELLVDGPEQVQLVYIEYMP